MGYRTIVTLYVAKWGIAQTCLCETKYQGGYCTIWGKCNRAMWGIAIFRARQRSGEGVVQRNGPKGCFWRVRFFSAPLRFSSVLRANVKGAEKKRTLQKQPFLDDCFSARRLLRSFGVLRNEYHKIARLVDWGVFQRTLTLILLQKYRDANGSRIVIRMGGVDTTSILTVFGSTPTPWSGPFRDHGLRLPLSTENPRNKGLSGSAAPIFGFGLADLSPKG